MIKSIILLFSLLLLVSCTQTTTDVGVDDVYAYERDYSQFFSNNQGATGNKVLVIDPKIPAWAAYDRNGHLVKSGRASAGKSYCADIGRGCKTVTGSFTIYSKKGASCESSKYPLETSGGAPMPYCMHFFKGYAIHGSYNVPDYNASHGCVRVVPSDAEWLSHNFVEIGTTVVIRNY